MPLANVWRLFKEYAVAGGILLVPAVLLFLVGYIFVYKRLMKGKKRLRLLSVVSWCGFIGYVFIVMGATLLSRPEGIFDSMGPNLNLFSTYRQAWHWSSAGEWRNLIMNIIMFIPIGFLLPLLSKKFQNVGIVVGSGFLMSAFIEVTQLLTGRGGFAVDDLFNNTLGAILGFCVYQISLMVLKKRPPRVVKWIWPWIVTVGFFIGVYGAYQLQEFGNLMLTPIVRQNMSNIEVTSGLTFSEEAGQATIFATSGVATRAETKAFSAQFFENTDVIMDEIIFFDGGVSYRGRSVKTDHEYSLWVNTVGLTFTYHNFQTFDLQPLVGVDEETIRELLLDFNIQVPVQATFSDLEDGTYRFVTHLDDHGKATHRGSLNLSLFEDLIIGHIENHIVEANPVTAVEIISEQLAFEKIKRGYILPHLVSDTRSLHIFGIELDWSMDSKGFLQPIYRFRAKADGIEIVMSLPAKK